MVRLAESATIHSHRPTVVMPDPKTVFDDFKSFIQRGNVLDMAVGIVIGVAFGAITKSLVDDIIMPVLGTWTGDVDFTRLFITLEAGKPAGPYKTLEAAREAGAITLNYGNFINTIVNFILVAAAMFVVVRTFERLNREDQEEAPPEPEPHLCPHCRTEIPVEATRCPACTSELAAES